MKKGQIQLSYGMIFSVFLIAVFVAVAVFAIWKFIDIQKCTNTGMFVNGLRSEIDRIYRSNLANDKELKLNLNEKKTEYVCFFDPEKSVYGKYENIGKELKRNIDDYENNFYFYPKTSSCLSSVKIERTDMDAFESNPYCLKSEEGEFKFLLTKEIRDELVKIK